MIEFDKQKTLYKLRKEEMPDRPENGNPVLAPVFTMDSGTTGNRSIMALSRNFDEFNTLQSEESYLEKMNSDPDNFKEDDKFQLNIDSGICYLTDLKKATHSMRADFPYKKRLAFKVSGITLEGQSDFIFAKGDLGVMLGGGNSYMDSSLDKVDSKEYYLNYVASLAMQIERIENLRGYKVFPDKIEGLPLLISLPDSENNNISICDEIKKTFAGEISVEMPFLNGFKKVFVIKEEDFIFLSEAEAKLKNFIASLDPKKVSKFQLDKRYLFFSDMGGKTNCLSVIKPGLVPVTGKAATSTEAGNDLVESLKTWIYEEHKYMPPTEEIISAFSDYHVGPSNNRIDVSAQFEKANSLAASQIFSLCKTASSRVGITMKSFDLCILSGRASAPSGSLYSPTLEEGQQVTKTKQCNEFLQSSLQTVSKGSIVLYAGGEMATARGLFIYSLSALSN